MKKIILLLATSFFSLSNAQSSWNISGNSGTNPAINFIGTTDSQNLVFKTNNTEWMRLTTKGRLVFQNIDAGLGWNNNLFIGGGNESTTGLGNTNVGLGSLAALTTGNYNTALGFNTLWSNTTGSSNIAIGGNSLMNSINANLNVGVGGNTLSGRGTLNQNVAVGHNSMARSTALETTIVSFNTAIGDGSLANIGSGNSNSAVGRQALRALLSGYNNVGIGENAGQNFSSGDNNIFIGNFTNAYSATANSELNIGNWIVGNNGTIGIGNFTNQLPADGIAQDGEKYKLFVKDGIKTEKIKVDVSSSNGWADYVFEKDYALMPLKELEAFIKDNGHLPEVPTTEEAIKNGIELKQMNILLLKKIEELTLYTIEQQKRLEALETKIKY